MKCRIVQIENYYQGQILVPVKRYQDGKEIDDGWAWQEIYDGEKYGNVITAKIALQAFVKEIRTPIVIEELEL